MDLDEEDSDEQLADTGRGALSRPPLPTPLLCLSGQGIITSSVGSKVTPFTGSISTHLPSLTVSSAYKIPENSAVNTHVSPGVSAVNSHVSPGVSAVNSHVSPGVSVVNSHVSPGVSLVLSAPSAISSITVPILSSADGCSIVSSGDSGVILSGDRGVTSTPSTNTTVLSTADPSHVLAGVLADEIKCSSMTTYHPETTAMSFIIAKSTNSDVTTVSSLNVATAPSLPSIMLATSTSERCVSTAKVASLAVQTEIVSDNCDTNLDFSVSAIPLPPENIPLPPKRPELDSKPERLAAAAKLSVLSEDIPSTRPFSMLAHLPNSNPLPAESKNAIVSAVSPSPKEPVVFSQTPIVTAQSATYVTSSPQNLQCSTFSTANVKSTYSSSGEATVRVSSINTAAVTVVTPSVSTNSVRAVTLPTKTRSPPIGIASVFRSGSVADVTTEELNIAESQSGESKEVGPANPQPLHKQIPQSAEPSILSQIAATLTAINTIVAQKSSAPILPCATVSKREKTEAYKPRPKSKQLKHRKHKSESSKSIDRKRHRKDKVKSSSTDTYSKSVEKTPSSAKVVVQKSEMPTDSHISACDKKSEAVSTPAGDIAVPQKALSDKIQSSAGDQAGGKTLYVTKIDTSANIDEVPTEMLQARLAYLTSLMKPKPSKSKRQPGTTSNVKADTDKPKTTAANTSGTVLLSDSTPPADNVLSIGIVLPSINILSSGSILSPTSALPSISVLPPEMDGGGDKGIALSIRNALKDISPSLLSSLRSAVAVSSEVQRGRASEELKPEWLGAKVDVKAEVPKPPEIIALESQTLEDSEPAHAALPSQISKALCNEPVIQTPDVPITKEEEEIASFFGKLGSGASKMEEMEEVVEGIPGFTVVDDELTADDYELKLGKPMYMYPLSVPELSEELSSQVKIILENTSSSSVLKALVRVCVLNNTEKFTFSILKNRNPQLTDISSVYNKALINLLSHDDMFRLVTAAGIQQGVPDLEIHPMVRQLLLKVYEEMTAESS